MRDVWEISVQMYWLIDETERERERDKDREWTQRDGKREYKEIKKQRIPVVLVLFLH